MTTTSGDPRNLNHFLEGSAPLRGRLTESAQAAVSAIFSRLAVNRGLPPYNYPPALNIEWVASKIRP